jgi:GNAT superfamily N-acetyltransferase
MGIASTFITIELQRGEGTGARVIVPAFRRYEPADRSICLGLFDANCPAYFAPNERSEYAGFLDAGDPSYSVCMVNGAIAGAFGLRAESGRRWSLRWIMLAPAAQGRGIGSAIMQEVVRQVLKLGGGVITIAASHKSAAFFARFGARELARTINGWGPDMHRVDMELPVSSGNTPKP